MEHSLYQNTRAEEHLEGAEGRRGEIEAQARQGDGGSDGSGAAAAGLLMPRRHILPDRAAARSDTMRATRKGDGRRIALGRARVAADGYGEAGIGQGIGSGVVCEPRSPCQGAAGGATADTIHPPASGAAPSACQHEHVIRVRGYRVFYSEGAEQIPLCAVALRADAQAKVMGAVSLTLNVNDCTLFAMSARAQHKTSVRNLFASPHCSCAQGFGPRARSEER